MKTVYTAPKISSLKDNGIKDLLCVASYLPELRLVYLTGVPVRIELNKEGYVELNSEEEKEEIDLSAYNDIFKSLFEFFYGTAYLYGFVNENKLVVYDAFTNDNFLSSRDLMFLENKYKIPIVKPVAEGNFTVDYLVEVLNKKINGEGMKSSKFYILPSVYVDDTRVWSSASENVKSKIILGEKKQTTAYTTWSGYNGSSSYTPPAKTITTAIATTPVASKYRTDEILTEIFKISTKEERQSIYSQTLKNINEYIKTLTLSEAEKKWWKSNGKFFTYLYSILTLPATRKFVYDYGEFYYLGYNECSKPIEYKWGIFFIDMFEEVFKRTLETKKISISYDFYAMFSLFFKEELIEFDKFFVKETDESRDWRYCKNFDYYGGLC